MFRIPQAILASFLAITITASVVAQDSIPWITDLSQARRVAEQQQRMVLLHFWGDGCPPCQQLETNVFNQPELIRAISSNFVPVKIHVQQQANIANYYKIEKIPTDIIVLPSGVQVFRTSSPGNVDTYIAMLDQVRANALANGVQEVDRVAKNVIQQVAPLLPTLPARSPDEAPTSQSIGGELSASNSPAPSNGPAWRNAPNALAGTVESLRSNVLSNEFVGPLDRKTQPTPTATGPRYGNPYINDTAAPSAATPAPTSAPAPNPATETAPANTADAANTQLPNPTPEPRENVYVPRGPLAPVAPTTPTAPSEAQHQNLQPLDSVTPVTPALAPQTNLQVAPRAEAAPSAPSPAPAANNPVQGSVQLPPAVPPLALDGYCPVTLMNLGKWEKGDPRFGAIHRDRTYLFKSQVERDRFLAPAAADRFAPVLSGLDPVRFTESNQAVQGRREHGVLFDGQIFLFADEEALVRFEQQPHRYVAVVRQAMANTRNAPPQR